MLTSPKLKEPIDRGEIEMAPTEAIIARDTAPKDIIPPLKAPKESRPKDAMPTDIPPRVKQPRENTPLEKKPREKIPSLLKPRAKKPFAFLPTDQRGRPHRVFSLWRSFILERDE